MKTIAIYLLFMIALFTAITCQGQNWYDSINSVRISHGMEPLKKSIILEIKASNWLGFLERHNMGMAHDTSTNDGECLTNAENPVVWWLNSASHKRVLLNPRYRKIGLSQKNGVWCARLN